MAIFRSDPCGIVCIVVTYAAVLYADYVVVKHLIIPSLTTTLWGTFNAVVFNILVFFIFVSHSKAVFSDPGIVPLPSRSLDFSDMHSERDESAKKNGWEVCMKCEAYRPPRAHHCRICRRCIRKMDHHCPWINNCVGEYNQKYFIQFLFYVLLASIHSTVLVIVSWTSDPGLKGETKHVKLLHSVLLVVESMLFGLFVIAIGCDQLSSVFSDETLVEHVKKEGFKRKTRPRRILLQEVFGRGHPLTWMIPFNMGRNSPENSQSFGV